jgi:glycosyltransferase involved in cell wall biosynthesis
LNPDAAIFHGSWTHAIFASVARRRTAVVGFWQHAPIMNPGWPDRWASWTRPDVLIANSRFTGSVPAFSGMSPHIIHCPVLPIHTVSAFHRAAARQQLGVQHSDVVVLMAARLEAWKGHSILIDAARRMKAESVKFWIAGGVQRPSEQAYFDQLRRDVEPSRNHIALLGQRDDVQHLMALADVYCQPNTAPEPFGLAIAEAMSAGLPCVVSQSGGATELVNPQCGILTKPGDAADVARALGALAADCPRRLALGTAARARVEMLTNPVARLEELARALNVDTAFADADSRATVA